MIFKDLSAQSSKMLIEVGFVCRDGGKGGQGAHTPPTSLVPHYITP